MPTEVVEKIKQRVETEQEECPAHLDSVRTARQSGRYAIQEMISLAIAFWDVASYSITEEKSHELRLEMRAMRGEA